MADGITLDPAPQKTIVYDRDNQPVFSFFREQRTDVSLDRVAPAMTAAVLAIEDRRFYQHHGIDFVRVFGAAWADVRARRYVQGGSSITQQLVRIDALSSQRTLRRKMREALLAPVIERRFSKTEILEAYLNRIYFGDGYYGVESAAHGYFGKNAADLTVLEAATLAGVIRSPRFYGPRSAPDRSRSRRNVVLRAMVANGNLSASDALLLEREPLAVRPPDEDPGGDDASQGTQASGLYFREAIRRELVRRFGTDALYKAGLRVYTTFAPDLQRAAETAVLDRIRALESTKAYQRRKDRPGPLQTAFVSLDPMTGDVGALVGGRDFDESRFDRATQARRQPGSAFKPLLFAAAIERGYSPGSIIDVSDAGIPANGKTWIPKDHGDAGSYTLRRALTVSSNRAAAQLMQTIGVASTLDYARRLGIDSPLPAVPSLALGTGELTLLELTSAYSTFANQGTRAEPRLIRRVEDRLGNVMWQPRVATRRAVSPETAFLVTSMLADVIQRGTGSKARALGFSLPAAGKTGTTDDFRDTWFVGYTPHLVAGVWFGFDEPSTILNEGFAATVAVPAWANFMKQATAGSGKDQFNPPPDVKRVTLCRLSGQLATDGCRLAALAPSLPPEWIGIGGDAVPVAQPPPAGGLYEDYVVDGTVGPCPLHGGASLSIENR